MPTKITNEYPRSTTVTLLSSNKAPIDGASGIKVLVKLPFASVNDKWTAAVYRGGNTYNSGTVDNIEKSADGFILTISTTVYTAGSYKLAIGWEEEHETGNNDYRYVPMYQDTEADGWYVDIDFVDPSEITDSDSSTESGSTTDSNTGGDITSSEGIEGGKGDGLSGRGDEPTTEDPMCITPSMLEFLVTQILGKVNERIAARIVNVISDTSDDKHVPSALAVFNFLRTVTPGMSCQTVVGSMDSVTEPNSRIIYLQKDDENDQTWTMYLWVDDAWVSIGDTSIDLVNYWSKSDADIAELREKILTTDAIQGISDTLDLANVLRNDEPSKAIVLEWIGSTSVDNISETGMASIIEAVLVETDKLYVKKPELTETLKEYVKKDELPAQPAVITEPQITSAVNAAFAATDPAI